MTTEVRLNDKIDNYRSRKVEGVARVKRLNEKHLKKQCFSEKA